MSHATHKITPLFGDGKPFHATSAEVEQMKGLIVGFAENYQVDEIHHAPKPAELTSTAHPKAPKEEK